MSVQLGKYQLVAEIARGGMGIVYLAVAQGPAGFSKLLVIKELKPEFVDDQAFLAMFLEEARLAARLSHPNIVQTYEIGEDGRRPYIVMDYLDGVTLSRIIRRKSTTFTRDLQLRIICEILQGLEYAHTLKDFDGSHLGIVHRDVTPQNVFVTFDGQAKIVDFGIAKALDSTIETRTGVLKGKPAYMAPEQITGVVDPRSDVFSAGVLVWEAVAGHRMWAKKNDVEVLAHMLRGALPDLKEVAPEVPEPLYALVQKALAQSPADRFASAAELHDALEAFLATQPPVTMREVGRVVGEIFAADRERTRAVIDQHLARVRAGGFTSERVPALAAASETVPSSRTPASETQLSPGVAQPTLATQTMQYSLPPMSPRAADSARPRRAMPWVLGAVALLLAGVGYGIGYRHRDAPAEPLASTAPSVSIAFSSTPESTASVTTAATNTVEVPSASAGASAVASVDRHISAAPPAARAPWTPARPRTAPTPTTPSEPRTTESDKTGYLTLDTYPWTRVSTGGKLLGDTPLVRVPLAAGTHVLTLENASEKLKTSTTVVVKPGETVSKRLAL